MRLLARAVESPSLDVTSGLSVTWEQSRTQSLTAYLGSNLASTKDASRRHKPFQGARRKGRGRILRDTLRSSIPAQGQPSPSRGCYSLCSASWAARDTFQSKTVEYHPGGVIFRPPQEVHSHQYGNSGAVALVIEVPSRWLRAQAPLQSLSELRFGHCGAALVDSAQLLSQLKGRRRERARTGRKLSGAALSLRARKGSRLRQRRYCPC